MKKRFLSFLLIFAIAFSALTATAFADNEGPSSHVTGVQGYDIDFYGVSGIRYQVNYSTLVGYNHTEVGKAVKVCQAFINAVLLKFSAEHGISVTTIAVDGIWGENSEAALREAQSYCGTTRDGVCGENTWRAMRSYLGGITSTVKSYL